MFNLMKFYVFHKSGFRAALSMNSGASNIWTVWLCSFMCIIAGFALLISNGITDTMSYIVLVIGLIIFMASYYFLPEAKRLHQIGKSAGNNVLFK